MRYLRQNKILELISEQNIETQDELASLLTESGFKATQATISRDIRELKLIKVLDAGGKYKYAASSSEEPSPNQRLSRILQDTVVSCSCSENMVVIKTINGCANASCEALDSFKIDGVLGTIAGDNTIFVVATSSSKAPSIVRFINEQIKSR